MDARGLVYFVESNDPVRLTHLATLVMSGVLLDRPVVVVWMGRALGHLMSGGLDAVPTGDAAVATDETSPGALLREARQLGSVTFLACSADARRLNLDRAAFLARVDDVLAMTTILHRIEGAGTVLYL
ncbi:MAG TPA: hypothetical protein VF720_11660 [Candidatus Eisenbacteria bacterium]